MAGGREIKTKIKSVQNTRKVTRALEMVSASKIRKAQERMKGSRPYARLMTQLIGHIAKANSEYTHPFMAGRLKQSPETAENAKARLAGNLKILDDAIGSKPFVAGERPSIADCTLFAALQFAEFAQVPIDPGCKNVARWFEKFKERPSAKA